MKKPTTVLTFSYIFLSMQSLKYNFESPSNLVTKWCVQYSPKVKVAEHSFRMVSSVV